MPAAKGDIIEEELQKLRRILAECNGSVGGGMPVSPVEWRLLKGLESLGTIVVALAEGQQRQLNAHDREKGEKASRQPWAVRPCDAEDAPPPVIHFKRDPSILP